MWARLPLPTLLGQAAPLDLIGVCWTHGRAASLVSCKVRAFLKRLKRVSAFKKEFLHLAQCGVSGLWADQTLGRLCLFTQSGRRPARRTWPWSPRRSGSRGLVLGFLVCGDARPPAEEERRPVRWVPSDCQGGPTITALGADRQGGHELRAPAVPTPAPVPHRRSRGHPQEGSRGRGVHEAPEEEN